MRKEFRRFDPISQALCAFLCANQIVDGVVIGWVTTSARTATNIQLQDAEEENTEYEAETIQEFKRVSGKPYYLVKWKGYPTSENPWEPIDHLRNCAALLRQYHTSRAH